LGIFIFLAAAGELAGLVDAILDALRRPAGGQESVA
jgi:hypothetical protein